MLFLHTKQFAILGGDSRQTALAMYLRQEGKRVMTWAVPACEDSGSLETVCQAEIFLLPVPLQKAEGSFHAVGESLPTTVSLLEKFPKGSILFAGQITPALQKTASQLGLRWVDYLQQESLTVRNATLTAEAAVGFALSEGKKGLCQMRCLVLGFGRIGKLLALRLQAMGAKVTVAARKAEDLTWAECLGLSAIAMAELSQYRERVDYCFNTVPNKVMSLETLCNLTQGCLLIDLASQQGFDHDAARALGHRVAWERGLPGRWFPEAAATALWEVVQQQLRD